jgi:hypothetical protein
MPGKTKRSASRDAYYKSYRSSDKASKNKEKRLLRHMNKHPNYKQATAKPEKVDYKRKKPLSYWEQLSKQVDDKRSQQATKRAR